MSGRSLKNNVGPIFLAAFFAAAFSFSYAQEAGAASVNEALCFSLAQYQGGGSAHDREQEGQPARSEPALKPAGLKKHWGRAAIEFSSFMMVSQVDYWRKYSKFIEDWQYRLTWKDQARRFFTTEALRFDSNDFKLNWSHSVAGAVYYECARANNLSWLESWGVSMFGALWWEYVAEWREVISLNDLAFTGIGGFPVGEAWHQFSRALAGSASPVLRALSFVNPLLKLNRWLDRKKVPKDAYAFSDWHEFSLSAGGRSVKKTAGPEFQTYYQLKTEVVNVPEYGRSASLARTIKDVYSTAIIVDLAMDEGHAQETNLLFEARPWGRFTQSVDESGRGHALFIGMGSALSYFKKRPVELYDFSLVKVGEIEKLHLELPRNFRDKLSVVHAAGPVLDWTLFGRGFRLRSVFEAYLDFSLVNAFALNEYSRDHDIAGMKTTVLYYGYYYGLGGTVSARTELVWRNVRLAGLASYGRWDSLDGRDRFQADISDDCDLDDSRTRLQASASWRIPASPLELFLTHEAVRRWGRIKEVSVRGAEYRTFVGLRYVF
jgi:hypothetical protein